MRDLARPDVLKPTACAALASTVLCLPRLLMWADRTLPIWYLESTIFIGSFVLWAFVFAWHAKYAGRPVFTLKIPPADIAAVVIAGIIAVFLLRWLVDPAESQAMPKDYPANFQQWLAMSLFALGLDQLFTVFGPYAWLIRLFRNRRMALILTVLFGVVVFLLKCHLSRTPIAPALFILLLVTRVVGTAVSVVIYLRGGLVLSWLWGFLVQVHLLPH